MDAAMRVILDMKSSGTLPPGAERAFAALGGVSVSHDVSGWDRRKDNFNINIRDLELHLRNDSRHPGVAAVEIAADIIHDGWHAIQHEEGRGPVHEGFASDPGACGASGQRAARFNQIIVVNEREANQGVIEFYRAVPGLPAYVRAHLIKSISSPSDEDLLDRYRGRRRTDDGTVSSGRGC
jgi:hypothetical protein